MSQVCVEWRKDKTRGIAVCSGGAEEMIVELIRLDDEVDADCVVFRDTPFTIGAAADLKLAVDGSNTSRRHCKLYEVDGTLWVRASGSGKGTYVNKVPVRKSPLASGDVLMLGEIRFRIFYHRRNANVACQV